MVTLNFRADTPIVVSIPCAVNPTKVHNGDELVVYRPSAVTEEAKTRSVPMKIECCANQHMTSNP